MCLKYCETFYRDFILFKKVYVYCFSCLQLASCFSCVCLYSVSFVFISFPALACLVSATYVWETLSKQRAGLKLVQVVLMFVIQQILLCWEYKQSKIQFQQQRECNLVNSFFIFCCKQEVPCAKYSACHDIIYFQTKVFTYQATVFHLQTITISNT